MLCVPRLSWLTTKLLCLCSAVLHWHTWATDEGNVGIILQFALTASATNVARFTINSLPDIFIANPQIILIGEGSVYGLIPSVEAVWFAVPVHVPASQGWLHVHKKASTGFWFKQKQPSTWVWYFGWTNLAVACPSRGTPVIIWLEQIWIIFHCESGNAAHNVTNYASLRQSQVCI